MLSIFPITDVKSDHLTTEKLEIVPFLINKYHLGRDK